MTAEPNQEQRLEIAADENEKHEAIIEHHEGVNKMRSAQMEMVIAQKRMLEAAAELKDADNRIKHAQMDESDIIFLNQQKMKNYFKKSNIFKKYL